MHELVYDPGVWRFPQDERIYQMRNAYRRPASEKQLGWVFNLNSKRGALRGRWRLATALVAAVLATGLAVAAYAQSQDTTITMTSPKVENALQYGTDLNFPGVADLSVRGSCPPANYSTTCDLMVIVAFDPPVSNLATKSMRKS
jgi:hypothetical protein